MNTNYPKHHYEIVNDLLEGKFLLQSDTVKFEELLKNKDNYKAFFRKTFHYELEIRSAYAFLTSEKTDEKGARNITIFLSLICYEVSQQKGGLQRNIYDKYFTVEEIEDFLNQQKAYAEVVEELKISYGVKPFLDRLNRRNLIEYTDNSSTQFRFTPAIDLFFEYARELANDYLEMTDE